MMGMPDECFDHIEEFKKHCSCLGITLDDSHFAYTPTIGLVCEYPSILSTLCPDLGFDKDELASWGDINNLFKVKPVMEGVLYGKGYIALADPVFRRGMYKDNNWAPRFISLFWRINDPEIDAYISLDKDRVRVNVDSSVYVEADTWYGPPFNNDISLIEDGMTHLRPPSDLDDSYLEFFFRNAYALDIQWKTKGDIKTFQALEFKGEKETVFNNGQDLHPVRYVHAEYDLSNKSFRHFDGAVQFFSNEEYLLRRDSNFNYNHKNSDQIKAISKKVFKLNGVISREMWTELSSHFFAANPLVYEYLAGEYPEHLKDTLDKIRASK